MFACFLLLALVATVAGWRVYVIREQLLRGVHDLRVAAASFTGKPLLDVQASDFEEARRHLESAEESFRSARGELEPWQPVLELIGGDAAAVLPMADIGLHGALAGQELYDSLEPLLSWRQKLSEAARPAGQNGLREVLTLLRQAQPGLREAREHLATAISAYKRIDRASLSTDIAQMLAQVDEHAARLYELDEAIGVLIDSPDLLASLIGSGAQKSYLVLAQNNDELRPAGGFIGTYGMLVVRDGEVVAKEFDSAQSPLLNPPSEPCPSTNPSWWVQLKNPVWACWDAHWTGDYPTLARHAKWFYDHGGNQYAPVDGVVALDLTAVELLLNALGPVSVPGYEEVVTGSNLRSVAYYYRGTGGGSPHKKFVGSVFKAVIERNLAQLTPERVTALLGAMREAVAGKHLLLYFTDPNLQGYAARLGADGAIRPASGDYLYVVDTSMQGKVYNSISRQLEYYGRINLDGSVLGEATVTWTFPQEAATSDPAIVDLAENSGMMPWLRTMSRIYVPEASKWFSTDASAGLAYPTYFATEGGKLLIGRQVDVRVGETRQLRYKYQVPVAVRSEGEQSVYQLLVQKQPGTKDTPLRVRLALPRGGQLLSTAPEARVIAGDETVVEFEATLATDTTFTVIYR